MPGSASSLRLFVGMKPPDAVKAELLKLNNVFPDLKFSQNPHLTLRFIGNVQDPMPYRQALRKIRVMAPALSFTKLGFFRQGILCVAPAQDASLTRLKNLVDAALASLGLEPETRDFHPHVTLCRLKHPPSKDLRETAKKLAARVSWRPENFHLFKSILTPVGAVHEIIETYALVAP